MVAFKFGAILASNVSFHFQGNRQTYDQKVLSEVLSKVRYAMG